MADFDPVGLAIDWLDRCKRNDCEGLSALYAVDATATIPSEADSAPGETLRGLDQIRAFWGSAFQTRQPAVFELVELYPGVNSVILIYYDEHCRRMSEFLQFDEHGLIIAAAGHAIPPQRQEAALLGDADVSASPMRKTVLRCEARQTLYEARRLPVGPTRNNLRQRAVALKELSKIAGPDGCRNFAIG